MNTTTLNARTVAIVKDYKVEKRTGINGEFESKEILFRIATDRFYKQSRQDTNGVVSQERPTDFWLARATGKTAEIFNEHCTAKREDGKLISRHLLLYGNFENYETVDERKVHVEPTVDFGNGDVRAIALDLVVPVQTRNTIFVVEGIEFLDSNPANRNGATAGAVSVAAAVAKPVQGATPATPAQPVSAPTTSTPSATPVAPTDNNTVTVTTTPAQPTATPNATAQVSASATIGNGMNPPTVDPNFTGEQPPF